MNSKSKIYTKGGDQGKTSLVNGVRVSKHDLRLSVYGTADELNSWLGHILAELNQINFERNAITFLSEQQNKFFDFGSLLACEKRDWESCQLKQIAIEDIEKIEKEIDRMEKINTPLTSFVLPGGAEGASRCHIARTVCRRLERIMLQFYNEFPDENNVELAQFLNRFSDYLFVLARYINKKLNVEEISKN